MEGIKGKIRMNAMTGRERARERKLEARRVELEGKRRIWEEEVERVKSELKVREERVEERLRDVVGLEREGLERIREEVRMERRMLDDTIRGGSTRTTNVVVNLQAQKNVRQTQDHTMAAGGPRAPTPPIATPIRLPPPPPPLPPTTEEIEERR